MTDWYESAKVPALLEGYCRTLAELRRRGVVRSNNAPAGDYAEWLVAQALHGRLADDLAMKSYDLTLPDQRRVQVKARVVAEPPTNSQLQTSPFRSWEFDLAALVLLSDIDYRPVLGLLAPVGLVKDNAKPRPHVNGYVVFIRPPLTDDPNVEVITDRLAAVAQ